MKRSVRVGTVRRDCSLFLSLVEDDDEVKRRRRSVRLTGVERGCSLFLYLLWEMKEEGEVSGDIGRGCSLFHINDQQERAKELRRQL